MIADRMKKVQASISWQLTQSKQMIAEGVDLSALEQENLILTPDNIKSGGYKSHY